MDLFLVGTVASVSGLLLWSNANATALYALILTSFIFVAGNVAIKILRALVAPYISQLKYIPGPTENQFLVGQALKMFKASGPLDFYLKWMRTWPDAHFIRHLSFGNSEILLVNSLEAHKEVMQTKAYSFVKPAFFEKLVSEFAGKGVLFSVGDEHRLQRRFLAGPFSSPNVRSLLPVFQNKARDLSAYLECNIKGETEGIIEIESAYTKTALDIVGVTILGIELNKLRSTSSSLSMNFEESYHHILNQKFLGFLISFINSFVVPLRWLPVAANRDFLKAKTALWSIVKDLVKGRFEEVEAQKNLNLNEKKREGRDLLTYMVEANLSGGEALSRQQIIGDILQFIIAAHETSAGSLTWTTYALAMNPDLQKRLRLEILDATRNSPVEPDYATIEGMHLLNNVLRESLRLYSPSLNLPREAAENVVIAGVQIPKGTTIMMIPAMIQQNPLVWGKDADEFKPDRWDSLSSAAANPYAMTAFSGGPRVCVGRSFAYLEMKAVLVELLSKFVFEPVDYNPKYLNPALTLKSDGGLKVKVRRVL